MSGADFRSRYGSWAIVAGASEGIGEAFARALASRGLSLVLVARRAERLEGLAATLRSDTGVEVRTLRLDLAEEDAAARLEQATLGLDAGLLVYNAAFAPVGPFCSRSREDQLRVLDTNCRTPMLLCHGFGARFRARGRGGIILMSSLAGFQGSPGVAHYAATKAYNLVLGEGLWKEMSRDGVDVLACCAGATRTPGYEANPAPERLIAPPAMAAADVAEEALRAIGTRPSMIVGRWNRVASFILRRFVSRRRAVLLIAGSTQALGKGGDG
jgi:short-subunit dehydrogenase